MKINSLRILFLSCHLCLLVVIGQSQNQANQWYFGFGCGLDFNTDPPTPLLNNAIHTDEGVASISDDDGALLFYTDGQVLINKNHQPMQNGDNLHGHFSTSQSVTIVPWPLHDQLYFVFTIGPTASVGLKYSVVDISQDNGLGAVIEKNSSLLDYVVEKQTVIPHANGRDYWLITHLFESNEYHSFLISCEGVRQEAIISPIGSSMKRNTVCCDYNSTIGCMKASPNGKMIATTWNSIYDIVHGSAVTNWYLELLDFNQETGKLSNVRAITQNFDADLYQSYGVCFSPDNSKLYQSSSKSYTSYIYQYDLLAGDISGSQKKIAENNIAYGSIEIGPDGKLYVARLNGMTRLTTIENPNELNPTIGFIDLNGRVSTWGLPNLIYDYTPDVYHPPLFVSDTSVCLTGDLFLDVTTERALAYYWNDGLVNAQRTITKPGLYYVDIETEQCGIQRDSIFVRFNSTNCTDDSFCDLIRVHPNPFVDDFTLGENFKIVLFDALGRKIYSGLKNKYSFEDLPSGMYFLKVENCQAVRKIIKLTE